MELTVAPPGVREQVQLLFLSICELVKHTRASRVSLSFLEEADFVRCLIETNVCKKSVHEVAILLSGINGDRGNPHPSTTPTADGQCGRCALSPILPLRVEISMGSRFTCGIICRSPADNRLIVRDFRIGRHPVGSTPCLPRTTPSLIETATTTTFTVLFELDHIALKQVGQTSPHSISEIEEHSNFTPLPDPPAWFCLRASARAFSCALAHADVTV